MKKILFLLSIGFSSLLQAAFMGIYDGSGQNRFVDKGSKSCVFADSNVGQYHETGKGFEGAMEHPGSATGMVGAGAAVGGVAGAAAVGAAYGIGKAAEASYHASKNFCFPIDPESQIIIDYRQYLGDLFGVNVFQPAFKNQAIYLYNNFGYWTAQSEEKQINGAGVYQIMITACPSIVRRVASNLQNIPGKNPVVAILSFCDGKNMQPLATDVAYFKSSDQFFIEVGQGQPQGQMVDAPKDAFIGKISTGPSAVQIQKNLGSSPRFLKFRKK